MDAERAGHLRGMGGMSRQRRDPLIATLAASVPMLRVTGIAAGGHALARLPPGGPEEAEVITGASRHGLALEGLGSYRFGDGAAVPEHAPALGIGYGRPAGRS